MSQHRGRALLLENPHANADHALEKIGLEVSRHHGALDEDELIEALQGVKVLGVRSKTTVSDRVLAACPDLLAIGAYCIGTNQIDTRQAARRGISVFNAPYANTRSVVELAICEIIALTRRLTVLNSKLHKGIWHKSAIGAHEVRGKTLGIIGYGNIGTQLSIVAEALGMRVIFYDIAERLAIGNAIRCDSLQELLERSDVVSLHVDGRSDNHAFIGEKEFSMMRRGTIFLNLSRGFVVDPQALKVNLSSGHLAGAALDVFSAEPKENGDPFSSDLAGFDNVILTPHIGGSTEEAQRNIGSFVSQKLANFVRKGSTDMSVNLPRISTSPAPHVLHRITWVHRNTPGVLALLNQAFAEGGANVAAQRLETSGEIGYLVTDVSSAIPVETLEALRGYEANIRLRVLDRD